jgi:hypothetical protein
MLAMLRLVCLRYEPFRYCHRGRSWWACFSHSARNRRGESQSPGADASRRRENVNHPNGRLQIRFGSDLLPLSARARRNLYGGWR